LHRFEHIATKALAPPCALLTNPPTREGGWAGVAFSRAGPLALAAARGFARDVAVYEGAARVRTLRASAQPYAIEFLPAGLAGGGAAALALAETHVVRAPGPASGPALGLRASRRRGGAVPV
jgi:hypothetical protein